MWSSEKGTERERSSSPEPEGRASGEQDGFGFGFGLLEQPEEGVVLHADLPEHLAAVPAGHGELQRVMVSALLQHKPPQSVWGGPEDTDRGRGSAGTHGRVGSQLDQEPLALETQLTDLGPVEGVDFCVILKKQNKKTDRKFINIHRHFRGSAAELHWREWSHHRTRTTCQQV